MTEVLGFTGRRYSEGAALLERLSSVQANAIAQVIAQHRGAQPDVVAQEATVLGGFTLSHGWIDSMECGPEN